MQIHRIYGLVDPAEPEVVRYVGCSRQKYLSNRLVVHVQSAKYPQRRGYNAPRSEWIRQVLAAGRRPQIIHLQTAFSPEEAASVEQAWIARLGRDQLTNRSAGGPGLPNPSPETQKRISEGVRRAFQQPEFREANRAHLQRLREHNRGTKRSPEARERMRQAALRRWRGS